MHLYTLYIYAKAQIYLYWLSFMFAYREYGWRWQKLIKVKTDVVRNAAGPLNDNIITS